MFLSSGKINKESSPSAIVESDYRAADVFLKYGVEFCCAGKWPLSDVCTSKNIDVSSLLNDLENATRTIQVSNTTRFAEWTPGFLADYIVNVHHQYLKTTLPSIITCLNLFLEGHRKKYPELQQLQPLLQKMHDSFMVHMQQEEEIFFPYIKQLAHAWHHSEPYAALLVKTLRKPLYQLSQQEQELLACLMEIRAVTGYYLPPSNACLTHRVTFAKLKELDNDLAQHMYLENDILFPKAIQIEKELLL
jgi:regulator of cell morphogenesis and NO signaling